MKANELRIGNYICRLDLVSEKERIEQIIELHKNEAVCSGPFKVVLLYGYLKPIPITEEWLFKFGFRTEESSCFELDNIQINTNRELMWIYTKCKSNIEIAMPEHIHQLQNLYFALTGEELLITCK